MYGAEFYSTSNRTVPGGAREVQIRDQAREAFLIQGPENNGQVNRNANNSSAICRKGTFIVSSTITHLNK